MAAPVYHDRATRRALCSGEESFSLAQTSCPANHRRSERSEESRLNLETLCSRSSENRGFKPPVALRRAGRQARGILIYSRVQEGHVWFVRSCPLQRPVSFQP